MIYKKKIKIPHRFSMKIVSFFIVITVCFFILNIKYKEMLATITILAGIYTTIATNTVTFSTPYSVSANTYSIIDVHALLSGTAQEFSVSCVMCLRIRITGYLETGGTSQYIRLYYTKAQEDTYLIPFYGEG